MTCEGNVCGVGTGIVVLPSDPDNSMLLSATPAYGGVDLNWQLPLINPHAVSYVEVYRSQMNDFAASLRLAQVGSDFYFDKVAPGVLYYYWIRSISVNGTPGDVIGPASAAAMASIDQTIRDLTGKIDAGLLAKTLKEPIESIIPQGQAILKEIQDRINANTALSAALQEVRSGVETAMTYVNQEISQRKDGDSALVTQINSMAAGLRDAVAAITTEQQVRVAKDDALSERITTLFGQITDATGTSISGAIAEEQRVRANADGALSQQITSQYTQVGKDIAAAIQSEATTRSTKDDALTQKIDTQYVQVTNDIAAAVRVESNARASLNESLTNSISTQESRLNGNIAQAETRVNTTIGITNGKVSTIGSLYTVKLNVNGLIGGWGTYNDGTTVQMGFDVDSFWVGRTGADMKKPFIIQDGTTFINDAVIYKLTFSKLRADDGSLIVENGKVKAQFLTVENAQSPNFSPGAAGWSIQSNGYAEFSNVYIRGNSFFSGRAQNLNGLNFLDFNATGSSLFMQVGTNVSIRADGSGYFARGIVSPPDIANKGKAYGNWNAWAEDFGGGWHGFTAIIDTGINVSGSWAQATEDMFLASATIAAGNSTYGGITGYSEVSLLIGDGLFNVGTPGAIDNRVYIWYRFKHNNGGGGPNFTATAIDWKLTRA